MSDLPDTPEVPAPQPGDLSPPATYTPMSIAWGMRAAALRTPSKIALREGDRCLTYAELAARTARFSGVVGGKFGLGRGDNVALVAPNCLEYIEIVMGASSAGVTVATLSPRLTPPEIQFACNDCQARLLIVHPSLEEKLRPLEFDTVRGIIGLDSSYQDLIANARPLEEVPLSEWDSFAIPYTSGTTGKPKGVVLSHRSRVMTFFAMASEYGCYSPDDRCLATAPLCHGGGFVFAAAAVFFGGHCEILSHFEPGLVIKKLHQEDFSSIFLVPTHFRAIFELERPELEKHGRPAVRSIISNAAPLAQPLKESIVDYFGGGVLHETYGSTEGGIVTNLRPADQLRKANCVGQPFIATQVRLLSADGTPTPLGDIGELHSRSPYLFNEYWNRPDETRRAFHDGRVSVGDMAKVDDEGYFYVVDRKDDLIVSGGISIYPREIEQVLNRHPRIAEAAVVGIADERLGEEIRAYVVRRSGAQASAEEILSYLRTELASYKLPTAIEFSDNLPKSEAGKLLKRVLREQAGS